MKKNKKFKLPVDAIKIPFTRIQGEWNKFIKFTTSSGIKDSLYDDKDITELWLPGDGEPAVFVVRKDGSINKCLTI